MTEPNINENLMSLQTRLDWLRTQGNIPYGYAVTQSNISGKTPVRRYGHNADVGATWETLYHESDLYVYLTSAERLQVASTDVDDDGDPADTGARTLFIQGLDTNYDLINETVTLNGQVNVLTDESYLRVFKAYVVTVGTTGVNEGEITVSNNADNNVLLSIPAGEGESHAAIFTVPADQTLWITHMFGSEITNKGIHFSLFTRALDESWRQRHDVLTFQNPFEHLYDFPHSFPEFTDIEIRVMGAAVAGEAVGGFYGWRET